MTGIVLSVFLAVAVSDWDCRSLSTFAGIVAIDRDSGMSRRERSMKTATAMAVGIGVIDSKEMAFLEELTSAVYASNETPGVVRESILTQCMAGRSGPARPRGGSI